MAIPLDRIRGMPAFSPYYPMPPARYRNACFHYVAFRASPAAVDRVLPACLTPRADGLCYAVGISVPWSASYGVFQESVLTVACAWQGQPGFFAPVAFLNSRSSIPAGREIYGTPKVHADVEVRMDERVMVTDTRVGGATAFSIRSTLHRQAGADDLPQLRPAWRLKVVPRADGQGCDVLQLVDGAPAMTDVTVHVRRAGDGVVEFRPTPVYDLSDFAPLEHLGAWYTEMDYTEGYGQVVHDFLRQPHASAAAAGQR